MFHWKRNKSLCLCSTKKNSRTWNWVNDRILISGWTIPFNKLDIFLSRASRYQYETTTVLPSGGSRPLGPVGWNPVMAHSIICLFCMSTDLEVSVSSLSGHVRKVLPALVLATCKARHSNIFFRDFCLEYNNKLEKIWFVQSSVCTTNKFLPVALQRWLSCTLVVYCRLAGERRCGRNLKATVSQHRPTGKKNEKTHLEGYSRLQYNLYRQQW